LTRGEASQCQNMERYREISKFKYLVSTSKNLLNLPFHSSATFVSIYSRWQTAPLCVNILIFERAKGGLVCKRMGPLSRFDVAKPRPTACVCGPKKRPEARKCRCLTVKVRPTLRRALANRLITKSARQHIFDKDAPRASEKKD